MLLLICLLHESTCVSDMDEYIKHSKPDMTNKIYKKMKGIGQKSRASLLEKKWWFEINAITTGIYDRWGLTATSPSPNCSAFTLQFQRDLWPGQPNKPPPPLSETSSQGYCSAACHKQETCTETVDGQRIWGFLMVIDC